MSLVSSKDFAIALGVSRGTVRSRLSRGSLVRNSFDLIDTQHPSNFQYILETNGGDQNVFNNYHVLQTSGTKVKKNYYKPKEKLNILNKPNLSTENGQVLEEKTENIEIKKPNKIKGSVNIAHGVETPKTENIIPKETAEERHEKKRLTQHREELTNLDLRKKNAEVENRESELQLRTMKLQQLAGGSLPLDIVANILKINFHSIWLSTSVEMKNFASVTCEILGGSKNDLIKLENDFDVMFKNIIEKTKVSANQEIQIYLEEYSQKKY